MNDIPADALRMARDELHKAQFVSGFQESPRSMDRIIARAIMAERERCAQIAESYMMGRKGGTAPRIAASIRKGAP